MIVRCVCFYFSVQMCCFGNTYKLEKLIVSAFEQSIWQTTARLFYGEITKNQVQNDMERLFDSKCKKK